MIWSFPRGEGKQEFHFFGLNINWLPNASRWTLVINRKNNGHDIHLLWVLWKKLRDKMGKLSTQPATAAGAWQRPDDQWRVWKWSCGRSNVEEHGACVFLRGKPALSLISPRDRYRPFIFSVNGGVQRETERDRDRARASLRQSVRSFHSSFSMSPPLHPVLGKAFWNVTNPIAKPSGCWCGHFGLTTTKRPSHWFFKKKKISSQPQQAIELRCETMWWRSSRQICLFWEERFDKVNVHQGRWKHSSAYIHILVSFVPPPSPYLPKSCSLFQVAESSR